MVGSRLPTPKQVSDTKQFVLCICGTRGATQVDSEFRVLTKQQALDQLRGLLSDKHGYSLVFATSPGGLPRGGMG